MKTISIYDVLRDLVPLGEYEVAGWVKTHRQSKKVGFIEVTDGSAVKGLQLVVDAALEGYQEISPKLSTGASIMAQGVLVESPAKGQKYEFQVKSLELIGEADAETYPLQKKAHTLEFLREQLHLRPRTTTFGAVFRVRSHLAQAINRYFDNNGFYFLHTPIITTADCEGAGELFSVTNFDLNAIPKENGKVAYDQDFFKEHSHLTCSGQLQAEIFAMGLSKVYTFGPTFRAENSNTTRHLAEFWMIEPEVAFNELPDNIALAESMLKGVITDLLSRCEDEIQFLSECEWGEKDLIGKLKMVVEKSFQVMDYTDAISILEKSGKKFDYPVKWGIDLQTEHERFITDEYVKGPCVVVNYPKEIKAFYMRLNEDNKTVRAMDVLVPRLGELIGGSQREERYDVLLQKMKDNALDVEKYWWYLDLRRFGTVPHSGFGMGFERLLMYVTGVQNIRDAIPFPRYPGFAGV